MRQVHIFFKISNGWHWLFPCFVRVVNPCCVKLIFRLTPLTSAAKLLNNFRFTQHGFTTLTKHRNNQTNWRITLENLKYIWICFVFFQLYCKSSKRWVGLKKSKTWWRNTWMVPYLKMAELDLMQVLLKKTRCKASLWTDQILNFSDM